MVTAAGAGSDRVLLYAPGAAQRRWRLRDWIAGLGLFAATAAVILWQNAHLAVLWDLSYVLDTADRMALGQIPYRGFPLVHAPLTFLVQAALIRLAGHVYWHHIAYVTAMGGLGTVLAWRITLETLRERIQHAWILALLLATPLAVLGIYCIFPHPSYDCDCAFWMLVAIWALQRAESGSAGRGFTAGALTCVPLFFKQNMGLPFLAAVVGAAAVLLIARSARRTAPHGRRPVPGGLGSPHAPEDRSPLALLSGVAVTLALAALTLHFTTGIGNCLHWTIRIAGQRRLPAFRDMLGIYLDPSLLWTLPCIAAALVLLGRTRGGFPSRIFGFFLLAAPFAATLLSLLVYQDADERGDALLALWPLLLILATAAAFWNLYRRRTALTLRTLLPFVVLVAVNGTLMSQQLWGSTYAIWPLLVLLLAETIVALGAVTGAMPRAWPAPGPAMFIAITLLVCGGFYTASEERLSYAQFPAGAAMRSAYPQLAGLAMPGEYLPDFDELLRYASAHIPFDDGLILIPGEDLFYYATGRVPRFPVLLFDPTTDVYSPQQVAALVRSRGIHWLIVKRNLQLTTDATPDHANLLAAVEREFTLATRLRGYDVYRR